MHHFGTGARHLQQLVVGNFVDFFCVADHARIAGEDAIDIGKNLAGIGVQCAGQRDGGQIGAAAAKRRRFAFVRLSLKSGDDDNVIIVQQDNGFASG